MELVGLFRLERLVLGTPLGVVTLLGPVISLCPASGNELIVSHIRDKTSGVQHMRPSYEGTSMCQC